MHLSKCEFLKLGGAALAAVPLASLAGRGAAPIPKPDDELQDITRDVAPISAAEHRERIARAQQLMQQNHIAAVVLEPGAAMEYFTGLQWSRSERLTAVLVPAHGEIAVVCPFFEEPRIRESLAVGKDLRVWQEHESPFVLMAQIMKDRGVKNGRIGFEATVRYFVLEGSMANLPDMQHTSADPVTRGCRMIKSRHELQLMLKASEVTLTAYQYVWKRLEAGMTQQDAKALMRSAQARLGGSDIWTMALFDEASAYPHGTRQQHRIKPGSVVLMDCGCSVRGYQSDISRTFVFGEPSAQVRKVWNTVRRGQQIAFETAKIGRPAGQVDDAVRAYYVSQGLGPGYKLPGLSHRTGHGIGMQGHEPVNFVHGEAQPLQPGMCFSDEPGIYLPGQFGVRLEDCIYLTELGPHWFTQPPDSLEAPIGKLVPLAV